MNQENPMTRPILALAVLVLLAATATAADLFPKTESATITDGRLTTQAGPSFSPPSSLKVGECSFLNARGGKVTWPARQSGVCYMEDSRP
jgi:hypothetical protein